jgi:hypothetical protein
LGVDCHLGWGALVLVGKEWCKYGEEWSSAVAAWRVRLFHGESECRSVRRV